MKSVHAFQEYMSGKSVAIIGGRPGYDPRALDRDVRVRANQNLFKQAAPHACDVAYDGCGIPMDRWLSPLAPTPRFMFLNTKGKYYSPTLEQQFKIRGSRGGTYHACEQVRIDLDSPHFLYRQQWLQRAFRKYKTLPLTGLIALLHVLTTEARSVFLTGMDFYLDEYGEILPQLGGHDMASNQRLLRDLIDADHRVIPDATLMRALEAPIVGSRNSFFRK